MLKFLVLLLVAGALFGQGTTRTDAAQYVKHAGGTKTVGYCLVWDSFGLVTQATCGAGGGETNVGANLGSGSVVYTGKSGVNLQFRSFTVGSNKLSVTQNAQDIAYDLIPANNLLSSFGGSLNLSQIAQGGATTGQLLQWNGTAWVPASTGGGGGPANTDALAEGSTNLYSTTGRIRAALSVTGILSYNNGTGVFSCSNCADITSSYSNPSWISALAYTKITGVPSFQLTSEKGAANGYASLGAGTLVPVAQLGTGTANSTTFLRGDGTWTNPAGSVNVLLGGSSIGTRPGLNFISGSGHTISASDDAPNNRVNITSTADTAILLSNAAHQAGTRINCRSTTGNDTYTCTMNPSLTAYTRGQIVVLDADTVNTGAATLQVDALPTPVSILTRAGAALSNGDITANRGVELYYNGTTFNIIGDGGGAASGTTVSFFPVLSHHGVGSYGQTTCFASGGCTNNSENVTVIFVRHIYADAATNSSLTKFALPSNWNSAANIRVTVTWWSDATSGNVVWGARGACGTNGSTLSPTQSATQATATSAAQGVAIRMSRVSIDLAAANLTSCAADRAIDIELQRLGADGADTMANTASIMHILIEYGVS